MPPARYSPQPTLAPYVFGVALLGLGMLLVAGGASAATFTVTKTADSLDGACDADCSLREAVAAANAHVGADVVSFGGLTGTFTLGALTSVTDALTFTSSGGAVAIAGQPLSLTPLVTFDIAAGSTITISSVIEGQGGVVKTGAGTLALAATNTYTGRTQALAGTLSITDDRSLGAAPTVGLSDALYVSGATLHNVGWTTLHGNRGLEIGPGGIMITQGAGAGLGFGRPITGTGRLSFAGPGSLFPVVGSTFTGGVTFTGGLVEMHDVSGLGAAPATLVPDHILLNNAYVTVLTTTTFGPTRGITLQAGANTIDVGGAPHTVTIDAPIVGAGSFTKGGHGTLILNGANSFTGTLTTVLGPLRVASDAAFGAVPATPRPGSVVIHASGGTVEATSSFTLHANRGVSLAGAGTFQANTGATFTIAGSVAGSSAFSKTGAGTLVLAGANTNTGTTTLSQGTLHVTGTASTSPISLAGGTLTGTGTVGPVTAAGAGGTIAPGTAGTSGVLSTGALALNAATTLAFDLAGASPGNGHDQLSVVGTVSLGGATLSTSLGYAPGLDTLTLVANDATDAIAGTLSGLAQGGTLTVGARSATLSYQGATGNDLTLTFSPGTAGSACDDANAQTVNDAWQANGTCAGNAIGSTCNDANAQTVNDVWRATGACAGVPVGSACDDANPATTQDVWQARGACAGSLHAEGTPCDDGSPATVHDRWNGRGGCAGIPVGTPCDDADPTTTNDAWRADWRCAGTRAAKGTPCDDGKATTVRDVWDGAGKCEGVVLWSPCDDGDAATTMDRITESGACVGKKAHVPGSTPYSYDVSWPPPARPGDPACDRDPGTQRCRAPSRPLTCAGSAHVHPEPLLGPPPRANQISSIEFHNISATPGGLGHAPHGGPFWLHAPEDMGWALGPVNATVDPLNPTRRVVSFPDVRFVAVGCWSLRDADHVVARFLVHPAKDLTVSLSQALWTYSSRNVSFTLTAGPLAGGQRADVTDEGGTLPKDVTVVGSAGQFVYHGPLREAGTFTIGVTTEPTRGYLEIDGDGGNSGWRKLWAQTTVKGDPPAVISSREKVCDLIGHSCEFATVRTVISSHASYGATSYTVHPAQLDVANLALPKGGFPGEMSFRIDLPNGTPILDRDVDGRLKLGQLNVTLVAPRETYSVNTTTWPPKILAYGGARAAPELTDHFRFRASPTGAIVIEAPRWEPGRYVLAVALSTAGGPAPEYTGMTSAAVVPAMGPTLEASLDGRAIDRIPVARTPAPGHELAIKVMTSAFDAYPPAAVFSGKNVTLSGDLLPHGTPRYDASTGIVRIPGVVPTRGDGTIHVAVAWGTGARLALPTAHGAKLDFTNAPLSVGDATLELRLTAPHGRPLTDATIHVALARPASLQGDGGDGTGRDGRYRFTLPEAPTGSFVVSASAIDAGGTPIHAHALVPVVPRGMDLTLNVTRGHAGAPLPLALRLAIPGGDPDDARIAIVQNGTHAAWRDCARAVSTPAGCVPYAASLDANGARLYFFNVTLGPGAYDVLACARNDRRDAGVACERATHDTRSTPTQLTVEPFRVSFDPASIVVGAESLVQARVTDADGRPWSGSLRFEPTAGYGAFASPDGGGATIPLVPVVDGSATLRLTPLARGETRWAFRSAGADEASPFALADGALSVEAAVTLLPNEVPVAERTSVLVRVQDARLEGRPVRLCGEPLGATSLGFVLSTPIGCTGEIRTDALGRAVIDVLPHQGGELILYVDGLATKATSRVVRPLDVKVNLEQDGARVQIIDRPSRMAEAGVVVTLLRKDAPGAGAIANATTDASGVARLRTAEAGDYTILATKERFGEARAEFTFAPGVSGPRLELVSLRVPERVVAGRLMDLVAEVANRGTEPGSAQILLLLRGRPVAAFPVEVEAGNVASFSVPFHPPDVRTIELVARLDVGGAPRNLTLSILPGASVTRVELVGPPVLRPLETARYHLLRWDQYGDRYRVPVSAGVPASVFVTAPKEPGVYHVEHVEWGRVWTRPVLVEGDSFPLRPKSMREWEDTVHDEFTMLSLGRDPGERNHFRSYYDLVPVETRLAYQAKGLEDQSRITADLREIMLSGAPPPLREPLPGSLRLASDTGAQLEFLYCVEWSFRLAADAPHPKWPCPRHLFTEEERHFGSVRVFT